MPDVSRRSSRSSTPLSTAGETVDVESELPAKQRHDVASVPSTSEKEVSTDSEKGKEVVLIDWDGPDDPANPRAWTPARQWVATIVVSLFTLLAPLTSTITAPATEPIAAELGIEDDAIQKQLLTSIMVLAFAAGPVFFGPLSELYGRRVILQISNTLYVIFNFVCAYTGRNPAAFLAFRFLAGFGGSAPIAIGGGVVGDIWHQDKRGKALAAYSIAPLLGPSMGPVLAAWIAEKTTYRWCFWSTSILSVVVQVAGLVFLHESYEPVLLERKANRYRKSHPEIDPMLVRTRFSGKPKTPQAVLAKGLSWPFRLFIFEPIVQAVAALQAVVYGLLYLFMIEVPVVYPERYGQSLGISGLHFIALGLGFITAAQVQGRTLDPLYKRLSNKHGGGKPEFRLPPLWVGGPLFPIGTLIFGWSAQYRVHWIVPDIGLFCIGAGMLSVNQVTQAYIIDAFSTRAASALAAVFCARALCGFGFPLFAPALFDSLDLGWGCTLLAGLFLLLAIPAGPLIYFFGERLRNASRHAKK